MICESFCDPTNSGAVKITNSNIDKVLESNEVVLICFYAEWCRFSNMMMPIFDEAADEVIKAGYKPGKVVVGKLDSEQESAVASRFKVSMYPILQLFLNGLLSKKYNGARSVVALTEFIKMQLTDPVMPFSSLTELQEPTDDKRHNRIIGHFAQRDQEEYDVFRRVACNLKDVCVFRACFGDASQAMRPLGQPMVVFRNVRKFPTKPEKTYKGSLTSFSELHAWALKKCIPLIREITFENGDEMMHEGLPFLILFHHPDDTESVKKYKHIVKNELVSGKKKITFVTCDGVRFEHQLHQLYHLLGQGPPTLPLITIDCYRRMHLFPKCQDMEIPGKLKEFLQDFFSNKLKLHTSEVKFWDITIT